MKLIQNLFAKKPDTRLADLAKVRDLNKADRDWSKSLYVRSEQVLEQGASILSEFAKEPSEALAVKYIAAVGARETSEALGKLHAASIKRINERIMERTRPALTAALDCVIDRCVLELEAIEDVDRQNAATLGIERTVYANPVRDRLTVALQSAKAFLDRVPTMPADETYNAIGFCLDDSVV